MTTKKEIETFIIKKLMRRRMWGHKHTNINNLLKGLPRHLWGSKQSKQAVDELLKLTILLSKPTNYGLEVSLNPKKRKDIELLV